MVRLAKYEAIAKLLEAEVISIAVVLTIDFKTSYHILGLLVSLSRSLAISLSLSLPLYLVRASR